MLPAPNCPPHASVTIGMRHAGAPIGTHSVHDAIPSVSMCSSGHLDFTRAMILAKALCDFDGELSTLRAREIARMP
jgi:hypothetical protein